MNHIKTYKQNISEPQIGDYVLCKEDIRDCKRKKFTSENIGQYIQKHGSLYIVQYENIPKELKNQFITPDNDQFPDVLKQNCAGMTREEILHWSEDKEDIEFILDTNKYNL